MRAHKRGRRGESVHNKGREREGEREKGRGRGKINSQKYKLCKTPGDRATWQVASRSLYCKT